MGVLNLVGELASRAREGTLDPSGWERLAGLVWPQVVAVTGSIGSGKSALLAILRERGWTTESADSLARQLREPEGAAYQPIVAEFGPDILDQGRIDPKRLGRRIFADPEARKKLERIIHPLLEQATLLAFAAWLAQGEEKLAYEAPTLFEAGAHKRGWKRVVLVTADPETRMARVLQRDGSDRRQVEARIAAQMPDEEKAALADLVLLNSGSLEDLAEKALVLEQPWPLP